MVRQAQVVLLLVLVVAMLDFVIGAFVGPLTDEEVAQGFVGLNGECPGKGSSRPGCVVFGETLSVCKGIQSFYELCGSSCQMGHW